MMLEVPVNLYTVGECGVLDFFVFGPGDLLGTFYGGLDRDDPVYGNVSTSILTAPLHHALTAIDALGGKEVFFAKALTYFASSGEAARYSATTWRALLMPGQLAGAPARRAA